MDNSVVLDKLSIETPAIVVAAAKFLFVFPLVVGTLIALIFVYLHCSQRCPGCFKTKSIRIFHYTSLWGLSFVLLIPNNPSLTPLAFYLTNILAARNFHEVVPQRLYRSGRLEPDRLTEVIEKYRIRSVVNLRLSPEHVDPRNKTERLTVEGLDADYFHVRLSSRRVITKEKLDTLIDTLESAPEPVLIHCADGTHRTGFGVVLWMYLNVGTPVSRSVQEHFSLLYGFSRIERTWASIKEGYQTLDELIWDYLKHRKKSPKPQEFIAWAMDYADARGVP